MQPDGQRRAPPRPFFSQPFSSAPASRSASSSNAAPATSPAAGASHPLSAAGSSRLNTQAASITPPASPSPPRRPARAGPETPPPPPAPCTGREIWSWIPPPESGASLSPLSSAFTLCEGGGGGSCAGFGQCKAAKCRFSTLSTFLCGKPGKKGPCFPHNGKHRGPCLVKNHS